MSSLWLNRSLVEGPHLALAITQKQFDACLKHLGIDKSGIRWASLGSYATTHALVSDNNQRVCVVGLDTSKVKKDIDAYEVLCHEAVHVWQEARDWYGEDKPSAEFEAYSVQNIARRLFDQYKALVKAPKAKRVLKNGNKKKL